MKKYQDWQQELQQFRLNAADLSKEADLSIGLMNLISLEEHLAFSSAKTKSEKYLELLRACRAIRKEIQRKLVKNPSAEEWCVSKHLLAASMRLFETGTKELDLGNPAAAEQLFGFAFELYSLFFVINLKPVEAGKSPADVSFVESTAASDSDSEIHPDSSKTSLESMIAPTEKTEDTRDFRKRVSELITQIVNCCKE